MRSPQVVVSIDRARIRAAAEAIRSATGVAVLAVLKADAYGLGAATVADVLAPVVDGFCVFRLAEAVRIGLWQRGRRPIIALGPAEPGRLALYRQQRVRPAVCSLEAAAAMRSLGPLACLDTGMQRLAWPLERGQELIDAGGCREVFTHAVTPDQAARFSAATAACGLERRHAAGSALLGHAPACLDAVRPGLALYAGAVSVTTRLIECHDSRGPIGYTRFRSRRHGILPLGYAHGLRPGLAAIGGRLRRIREVGMQTAYVDIGAADRPGHPVQLLGPDLTLEVQAKAWRCALHTVLLTLAGSGRRRDR